VKPVVALVGRPNVGKSTLFNRLTRSRDALVADFPGLTRDRHYGEGRVGPVPYLLIDTGGFEPTGADGIVREMARQAEAAIAESDVVIFVLDARDGLTPHDMRIAQRLRAAGKTQGGCRVIVAVNKAEGLSASAIAEFHELALGEPHAVSAAHGDGINTLMEAALAGFEAPPEAETDIGAGIRVAVVGRPNAGKSTLINALLGEERMIAFDAPGTTRDAIEVPFEYGNQRYTLIDTAGLRRKGRVFETIEKFSVVKTLQAISASNVVILVLDATEGVAEQDAHIAGFVLESGRALTIAVNKWDGLDSYARDTVKRELERKLHFLNWAKVHFVSAKRGTGLAALMRSVTVAHKAAFAKLPTPRLTRAMMAAVERQPPPRSGRGRPKMRYAHQGGHNPPIVVIHGSALSAIGDSYRRYLEGWFRDTFDLAGTPLRIEFRTAANPYVAARETR
jgi:GTP-binding protein